MGKKRTVILLLVLLVIAGLCLGAAVTSSPYTGAGWNTGAPNDEALGGNAYQELQDLRKGVELRINREHTTLASSSAGGWHRNGSAVCYEGTTAEPNLPDDSAALSNIARDRGRLWIDDNFDPPAFKRWAGAAYEELSTIGSGSAPKAYLISDANENTDGGRESKIIIKGEKDDDTSHELVMIQGSHDGTGDDKKADIIFFCNDGDDADGSLTEVLRIDSAKLATFAGAVTVTDNLTMATGKTATIEIIQAVDATGVVIKNDGGDAVITAQDTGGALLQDSSRMTTSAAPTSDEDIANKKYVDDTYLAGQAVQIVNVQTGDVNTGTTTSPDDDTIPQNTEGDQYMTLAITPTHSSNKLKIDVVIHLGNSNTAGDAVLIAALFQDSTAGALAAAYFRESHNRQRVLSFTHYMDAGTTSATTFKIRAGSNAAGTTTFNGVGGSRKLGGVLASSITITEIKV